MRAVCLVIATGCFGGVNARGSRNGLDGAGIAVDGPVSKLRIGLEAVYERVSTDAERRGVFGYDVTVRAGVVSAIAESRCEACVSEPRIDFGPGAGIGVATTSDLDLVGHSWIGGWADIRLSKADSSYPVLRIELQRDAYSGTFHGDTQLVIGIGAVSWGD